jgi:hypothetical protein
VDKVKPKLKLDAFFTDMDMVDPDMFLKSKFTTDLNDLVASAKDTPQA